MSPSQWWVVHQDRWWTASQSVGYAGWASSQSKNQTSWTPIPLLMIPGVAVRGVDPASPCVLTSSRIAAAVSPLMIHTSLTPEVLFNSLTLYVITWNWLFLKSLIFFYFTSSLPPDDCAALLLACLYCRFHELMVLLPDTCERAVSRCFPSYRYIKASTEREQQGKDCCNYKVELDCNCCGSCHDAGELIELAMEISEVCYRWGRPSLTCEHNEFKSRIFKKLECSTNSMTASSYSHICKKKKLPVRVFYIDLEVDTICSRCLLPPFETAQSNQMQTCCPVREGDRSAEICMVMTKP